MVFTAQVVRPTLVSISFIYLVHLSLLQHAFAQVPLLYPTVLIGTITLTQVWPRIYFKSTMVRTPQIVPLFAISRAVAQLRGVWRRCSAILIQNTGIVGQSPSLGLSPTRPPDGRMHLLVQLPNTNFLILSFCTVPSLCASLKCIDKTRVLILVP